MCDYPASDIALLITTSATALVAIIAALTHGKAKAHRHRHPEGASAHAGTPPQEGSQASSVDGSFTEGEIRSPRAVY